MQAKLCASCEEAIQSTQLKAAHYNGEQSQHSLRGLRAMHAMMLVFSVEGWGRRRGGGAQANPPCT